MQYTVTGSPLIAYLDQDIYFSLDTGSADDRYLTFQLTDDVWNNLGGWSASGATIIQMDTLGSTGVSVWAAKADDLANPTINQWIGGWEVYKAEDIRGLASDHADRLMIQNVDSDVSHQASAQDWRAGINSFTDLSNYVEARFQEAYAAETTHPFSLDQSRAFFYTQWVSGLWNYGNLINIYQPGAVQDNEVTGTVDPATMSVRTFLDSPIGCCTDYVTVLTFLLSQAGIANDIVGGAGHVMNEALIDGQWWTLDANIGVAYQGTVDDILDLSKQVMAYGFDHEGMQLGSSIYREALPEFRQVILTFLEDGLFEGGYRYNSVEFLQALSYGNVFLSEVASGTWPPADDSRNGWLTTTPDLHGLSLDEYYIAVSNTAERLNMADVDSEVAKTFAEAGWRAGVSGFSGLKTAIDAVHATEVARPEFSTAQDQAFYYMQAVSGLWTLNTAAGSSPYRDMAGLLASATGTQSDFATTLAALLTEAGLQNRVVTTTSFVINEVLLDGHWWSLNAAANVAVEGAWQDVSNTSQRPEIYLFDNAHLQAGSSFDPAVAFYVKTFMAAVANGVEFDFARFSPSEWFADHPYSGLLWSIGDLKGGFAEMNAWSTEVSGTVPWVLGDFNGDGRDDVFAYRPGVSGAAVMLSDGTSFQSPTSWTGAGSGTQGWYVGDFNGDGKDDILRYVSGVSGGDVLLSTGSGFVMTGSWTNAGQGGGGRWFIGDFNGDGKDDLLRYNPGVSGAEILLSTGSQFVNAGGWSPAGYGSGGRWLIGDFNGDGKDDLARLIDGAGMQVLLSDGATFGVANTWFAGASSSDKWTIGDFNGDGRDDFLRLNLTTGATELLLSTGTSFVSGGTWSNKDPGMRGWFVGDFNGDGMDDVFSSANAASAINVALAQIQKVDDHYVGQSGVADQFVFNQGHDTIAGFDPSQDVVKFDHAFLADYAALQAHMSQVGLDVVITLDAQNSLTFHDLTLASLSSNDFLFT